MIARLATTLSGIVLIVYGVIAAISPLPLGVPLVVLGLIMIAGANPAARPMIRWMREHWRWFDFLVTQLARRSPRRFKEVLEETKPAQDHSPGPAGKDQS